MSTIRFVHTDHLRLGSALTGLADSPEWLQQLATGCIRHAVRNLIETTVAQEAQFLFIAGRLTESSEGADPACRWLDEELQVLRDRGIRIVAASGDHDTTRRLEQICDVVLQEGQTLLVSQLSNGRIELTKASGHSTGQAQLVVTPGHFPATDRVLVYQAAPSLSPGSDRSQVARHGRLTLSAGPVQAVNRHESGECGCIVVEARPATNEIQGTFVSTDVIRFATEQVTLSGTTTPDALIPEVLRVSSALEERIPQTVIVDWVLTARTQAHLSQIEKLSAASMLSALRNHLHGGHHGVWPRSVSFSSESVLLLEEPVGASVEQYLDVVAGPVRNTEASGLADGKFCLQGRPGLSADLITGLTSLQRVA